jgi:hypothetical protein
MSDCRSSHKGRRSCVIEVLPEREPRPNSAAAKPLDERDYHRRHTASLIAAPALLSSHWRECPLLR